MSVFSNEFLILVLKIRVSRLSHVPEIVKTVNLSSLIELYLFPSTMLLRGFPGGSEGKDPPAMQEIQFQSPGREDPLEKEMATHSSTLAWEISWTEGPDRL